MNKNKKNSVIIHVVTPVMLALVCTGITVAAAVKPMDKIKVYTNIAFMDSLRSNGSDSGLVIRDNDIPTDYSGPTASEGSPERPAFGELYAIIRNTTLGIDVPVYWGSTPELLERGACQSSGSSVLGTAGNAVISAHVDTYFAELYKLKEGDTVTLFTTYGKFTYTVSELITFDSSNRKYISPTDDDRLTLYTCKRDLLGASNQRTGVVCELTESLFYAEKDGDEQ